IGGRHRHCPPMPTAPRAAVELRPTAERQPPYPDINTTGIAATPERRTSLNESTVHGQGGGRDDQLARIAPPPGPAQQPTAVTAHPPRRSSRPPRWPLPSLSPHAHCPACCC